MPAFNFQKRFAPGVKSGAKPHTIRADRKDGRQPCKPGDILKLYTGMRTKACELILTAKCIKVRRIEISVKPRSITIMYDRAFYHPDTVMLAVPVLENFARRDGFESWAEMLAWFETTHGLAPGKPFKGWFIEWTPPAKPIEPETQHHG